MRATTLLTVLLLCGGCDGAINLPEADAGTVVQHDGAATLPCDVDQLMATHCRSCHRATPSGGAPMPLVTRAHFLAATPSNPAVTAGMQSVTRMKSATSPMPPSGALNASDVQVLESWVNAGMPEAACGAIVDAGIAPFDAPPQCTSGTTWTRGNSGSQRMNPGRACLACHVRENEGDEEAPEGIAGTVYPTAHEPELCNGLPGNANVIITGADGREFSLRVNDVGNFYQYRTNQLVRPYTARVEFEGRTRRMTTPQMSGDCNGCHTQAGTDGAPGRILAP